MHPHFLQVHKGSEPWSQLRDWHLVPLGSPQLLAPMHMGALAHGPRPLNSDALNPDAGAQTQMPSHTGSDPCCWCSDCPTHMYTFNRVPCPDKKMERKSIRRQDILWWSGTGQSRQAFWPANNLHVAVPFLSLIFPLFSIFPHCSSPNCLNPSLSLPLVLIHVNIPWWILSNDETFFPHNP